MRHAGRGGTAQAWPHDRAHWFFARARWDPDELGLAVARLVAALLVPAREPVVVAIDVSYHCRYVNLHDGDKPL